jgi:hypothetical protein
VIVNAIAKSVNIGYVSYNSSKHSEEENAKNFSHMSFTVQKIDKSKRLLLAGRGP